MWRRRSTPSPGASRPAPGNVVTPCDFGACEYGAVIGAIFADDFNGIGIAHAAPTLDLIPDPTR